MAQYWCRGESLLQVLKCLLTLISPGKGSVLPSELVERSRDPAIVLNESSIEVAKAKERLNAANGIWWFPLVNYCCLLRIDLNPIRAQDEAQVLSLSNMELALLDAGLEACSV